MEEVCLPIVISNGYIVVGRFMMVNAEDVEFYAWLVRYESEEEQKRIETAAQNDDRWESDLVPGFQEVFDDYSKAVLIRLDAFPTSILR